MPDIVISTLSLKHNWLRSVVTVTRQFPAPCFLVSVVSLYLKKFAHSVGNVGANQAERWSIQKCRTSEHRYARNLALITSTLCPVHINTKAHSCSHLQFCEVMICSRACRFYVPRHGRLRSLYRSALCAIRTSHVPAVCFHDNRCV